MITYTIHHIYINIALKKAVLVTEFQYQNIYNKNNYKSLLKIDYNNII